MTAPARFKQSDVSRAMKGAKSAGFQFVQVKIDVQGNMVINAAEAPDTLEPARINPLDRLLTGK